MSTTTGGGEFSNPLRKFKLVFLGEQSGKQRHGDLGENRFIGLTVGMCQKKLLKIDVANYLVLPVVVGQQVGIATLKAFDDTQGTCLLKCFNGR